MPLQTDLNRIVDLDLGLRVVRGQRTWGPLCVHFADTFLDVELNVDLLISGQLDNGNSKFFAFVDIGKKRDRLDGPFLFLLVIHTVENRFNIKGGDFTDLLIGVFDTEYKILFAPSAVFDFLDGALALPGVIKLIGLVADEGEEADSLAKPFIVEYGGVLNDADEVRGQCGYLRDEDSAKGVGETHVATGQ